jgi:hypothetical protein
MFSRTAGCLSSALEGLIFHGLQFGEEPTYVPTEGQISAPGVSFEAEKARQLATFYLASHITAKGHDFAWWLELPVETAHSAIKDASGIVQCEIVGGYINRVLFDRLGTWPILKFQIH